MSLDEPVVKSAYRPRGAAQKQRRLELKVIRADERYRARYQALKAEMAASGHSIGDQSVDLDRGALGSAGYREGDEEEAFDLG